MMQVKQSLIAVSAAALISYSASAATVIHYWDMDTLSGGVPTDVVGGVTTTAVSTGGGDSLLLNTTYGEAYAGAGNALITTRDHTQSRHLLADVYDSGTSTATAMNFGAADFSFSYWSYDDATDSDIQGPRVFDNLAGTDVGFLLGSNTSGVLNLRLDDDAANNVNSVNELTTLTQADNVWTHVAVNVSRSTDTVEIFFNGSSQGTYAISGLTGNILPSQDIEIGVLNGGDLNGNDTQNSGLDDLAFYSGLLSSSDVTGLANGTLTPNSIPEPSSMALLSLGLLGLIGCGRRRGPKSVSSN
jgi:hypothetical protein